MQWTPSSLGYLVDLDEGFQHSTTMKDPECHNLKDYGPTSYDSFIKQIVTQWFGYYPGNTPVL